MTEQLLWQLCNNQIQFFGALVETRPSDENDSRFVREMEDVIPSMSRLSTMIQQVQSVLKQAALEGRIKAIQETGEEWEALINASLRLCMTIQVRCLKMIEAGYEIATLKDLEQILDDLRTTREKWILQWPFVDPKMLERTATEYAEGNYQSAKDAFHELRNHHS